jgi:hypothetical protein
MIKFQFFPRSQGITDKIRGVITCFENEVLSIQSPENNLTSNEVLKSVAPHLEKLGFVCESGKTMDQKISVPVLFGYDNKIDKSFRAF